MTQGETCGECAGFVKIIASSEELLVIRQILKQRKNQAEITAQALPAKNRVLSVDLFKR
jgi:hypothetical protein